MEEILPQLAISSEGKKGNTHNWQIAFVICLCKLEPIYDGLLESKMMLGAK